MKYSLETIWATWEMEKCCFRQCSIIATLNCGGKSGRACLDCKGNILAKYKDSNDLSNRVLKHEQCELNQNKLKLQIKRFLLLNVISSMKAFSNNNADNSNSLWWSWVISTIILSCLLGVCVEKLSRKICLTLSNFEGLNGGRRPQYQNPSSEACIAYAVKVYCCKVETLESETVHCKAVLCFTSLSLIATGIRWRVLVSGEMLPSTVLIFYFSSRGQSAF